MDIKLSDLHDGMTSINGITRQTCEVYSRIVGYFRPIGSWNAGKEQEYKDRKTFKVK